MTLTDAPDQISIKKMFDRLSGSYDMFNRLTSMGLDGIWRKKAVCRLKSGMRVLDLGCGTGDLTFEAARKIGLGEVVGLDFSEDMLAIARKRSESALGAGRRFVRGAAESIPFEPEPYDAVISGFVLRNIYENIDSILEGVHASLKKGGEIAFLDFTEPSTAALKKLWHVYMNTAATFYGKMLYGKDFPETYMTESARRFVKAPEFLEKLTRVGFRNISAERMMFGIIVLYRGVKA